jgi:MurNAc alpha-1-phosphate uridylyltransferase
LRAIVLAAGRGERMRPLTDQTPKPLLPVHGRPMIEWHLLALAAGGVEEVVINTAWLEDQFPQVLGDGSRFGLRLSYSAEGRDHGGALETAGGIAKAASWLSADGRAAFWVVSGDIWAPDFAFAPAVSERFVASGLAAQLWVVPNPAFHPRGDFALGAPCPALGPEARIGLSLDDPEADAATACTYANLALLRADFCAAVPPGTRASLGPLLHAGMRQRHIGVELYRGRWENVGTPQQWAALQVPAGLVHPETPDERSRPV